MRALHRDPSCPTNANRCVESIRRSRIVSTGLDSAVLTFPTISERCQRDRTLLVDIVERRSSQLFTRERGRTPRRYFFALLGRSSKGRILLRTGTHTTQTHSLYIYVFFFLFLTLDCYLFLSFSLTMHRRCSRRKSW